MIISYGEILADMIGREQNGTVSYERYAGGAPFNVACAIARSGGNSGFIGSVGNDIIGKYLCGFAKNQKLDFVDITILPDVNTTLAFVELAPDGERSFCFYRKSTADYMLSEKSLEYIKKADTVHIGSLMLSESKGIEFADKAVEETKKHGKKLSFDVNYRDDIFPDAAKAKKIYAKYAQAADIVKYSENELEMFTGEKGLGGIKKVSRPDKLICVTLGGNGSAYCIGDRVQIVPSIKVKPIDTTGAGDAFYGALLGKLDGKNFLLLSDAELNNIFRFANIAGALATTARGAISSLPEKEQIEILM